MTFSRRRWKCRKLARNLVARLPFTIAFNLDVTSAAANAGRYLAVAPETN